jgi:lecithin:retinol acyltransferase
VHIAQSQRFITRSSPSAEALGSLCRGDRLLAAHEEPPLGAHLVTPRFAYAHHGVYVGGGAVVHYAAFAKHWHRGPVEETSLTRFADRHPVWVRAAQSHGLQAAEIVGRARSRIGEDRYRFFTNNCEHFSEWCVNGEHRSPQIERLLAPLRCVAGALNDLLRLLKATPLRGGDRRCTRPT